MNAPAPDPRHAVLERRVTVGGLVINVALATAKVLVGLLANSTAIIADGLHSASDLMSDVAVLWGIRAARRPADADHHYGHARYEAIVTLFVGMLLIGAAGYVAVQSLVTLSESHTGVASWWPFWTAVASISLKEALFWVTRAVGRRTGNRAVVANAWHHRSDSFSSVAAAAGIAGTILGGPRWAFLDHVTAIVLAAFLVIVGIRIARDALRDLSDRAPASAQQRRMAEIIARIPGVTSYHAFRARQSGGNIEMDVHIRVDPGLTVERGHAIATRVEAELCAAFPGLTGVVVHVEPEGEPHPDGRRC